MKPRHLLMLAAFCVASWLVFFGDKAPDAEGAQPAARSPGMPAYAAPAAPAIEGPTTSPTLERAASGEVRKQADLQILTLLPRPELIAGGSAGENDDGLFSSKSWAPPPGQAKAGPPPPPSAPPLPFTYLGRQAAGGPLEVYLARGDAVFVAREQTVIEGTYRVESIKPPTLSLTYLPLNQIQQLSIGVTD